jgi:hypothetical protein
VLLAKHQSLIKPDSQPFHRFEGFQPLPVKGKRGLSLFGVSEDQELSFSAIKDGPMRFTLRQGLLPQVSQFLHCSCHLFVHGQVDNFINEA